MQIGNEATVVESDLPSVQPKVLSEHQCPRSSDRKDQRSQAGQGDNSHTRKQRATKVEVLLLLGSCTNESDRAHHANRVQTSTCENSRAEEHERAQERSLGQVEASPESVLDHVVIRGRGAAAHHCSNASDETNTEYQPGVRRHETVGPAVQVECPSSNADDTDSESSVQERVVEVGSLEWRHAAILAGLAVEDEVDRQECATKDGAAVNQSLSNVALCERVRRCGGLIAALAALLEGISEDGLASRGEGLEGRCRPECLRLRGLGLEAAWEGGAGAGLLERSLEGVGHRKGAAHECRHDE